MPSSTYAREKWSRQPVRDKLEELKEMIDWHRMMIGPENAERLKIRIDDLFRSAVRHGKQLAEKRNAAGVAGHQRWER